mmetsp:Transcript_38419/g.109815  ORF Transcript_38419/g.109815 Transcript_38419/m.109815 type:complete len:170 (-) Transcript_38419:753-1262(-)
MMKLACCVVLILAVTPALARDLRGLQPANATEEGRSCCWSCSWKHDCWLECGWAHCHCNDMSHCNDDDWSAARVRKACEQILAEAKAIDAEDDDADDDDNEDAPKCCWDCTWWNKPCWMNCTMGSCWRDNNNNNNNNDHEEREPASMPPNQQQAVKECQSLLAMPADNQ